jgi:calcium-dependent protein kinase
LTNLK